MVRRDHRVAAPHIPGHTLRVGLLSRTAGFDFGFCLAVLTSLFSWELVGSIASLLGTGVALFARLVGGAIELDFDLELSWRVVVVVGLTDGEELGALALPAAGVLAKKPRMLCCLPVDCLPVEGACPGFLAVDGVFAGVRAAAAFLSAILPLERVEIGERIILTRLVETPERCNF